MNETIDLIELADTLIHIDSQLDGGFDKSDSNALLLAANILRNKALEQESKTWSLDDAREDFLRDVYNILDFLPTNDEANRIIYSFDTVTSGIKQGSKWIPCNERLPEEHEWIGTKAFGTTISNEVYVTFENPKGKRFTKHLSFQNGKVSNSVQREIDALYKGSVPIAWMPLPEPYKEEMESEE